MEITAVRQMWAGLVNRELQEVRRPERVDHRSRAAQRQEALQTGDQQKAAELDRAPQVKLGSKAVQMERRGVPSDRGNQLREVQEENRQRQALVLEIAQLRGRVTAAAPASHQEAPPPYHSPAGHYLAANSPASRYSSAAARSIPPEAAIRA